MHCSLSKQLLPSLCILATLLSGCRVAPKRFKALSVVPAPKAKIPPGTLAGSTTPAIDDALSARFADAVQYQQGKQASGNHSLLCEPNTDGCSSRHLLSVTPIASPAPPPPPKSESSVFFRMAERAQAEFIHQAFPKLAGDSKADPIASLFKQLGDKEKPGGEGSPLSPRVQLTISHLLSLPGEWERLQYLAMFFVLHSSDVRFIDTNEFESVFRDIDIGKLTQTAETGISGTASAGFGGVAANASTQPGSVSVTPSYKYTEALERQLKEQLQFRSSSIDFGGRVFAIVLKSSQANKLPTLIRQIVTLEYDSAQFPNSRAAILVPKYKANEFVGFDWMDQVARIEGKLASSDKKELDPSRYETWATPIYVGAVRRVINAQGVNSSPEDDDEVQYVAQSEVLPPIRLDSSPKVVFLIGGKGPTGDILVGILPPGESASRQAKLTDVKAADKFMHVLRQRIKSAKDKKNGLVWGDGEAEDLKGFKIVWGIVDDKGNDEHFEDWTAVDPDKLCVVQYPGYRPCP